MLTKKQQHLQFQGIKNKIKIQPIIENDVKGSCPLPAKVIFA